MGKTFEEWFEEVMKEAWDASRQHMTTRDI